MPLYSTRCTACREERDVRLSFAQYDEAREGKRTLACKSCGEVAEIQFAPGNLGFTFRDGESGGWASKAMKENAYRNNRRAVMTKREQDHVFKPKLVPNYKGEEAPTWKDAQEAARADAGEVKAVTYEPLVQQEQS